MTENPNFYAIIPANVRYSDITPNAKLLYGEITALTTKTGKCFATNEYFASLYNVSKVSISKWIRELADHGFIRTELIYKQGSKQILNRYITILNEPIKEIFNTPIKEKFKDNITDNNITSNNNLKKIQKEIDFGNLETPMKVWLAYKKERGQTYKPLGLKKCFEFLRKISNDNEMLACKIVDRSIANNWSGLFELEKQNRRPMTDDSLLDPETGMPF